MWLNEHWPMPWMFTGPAVMLIFIIAVCITAMFLMRGMGRHSRGDPLDILKERLARGDINQAEYEERRRLLQAR